MAIKTKLTPDNPIQSFNLGANQVGLSFIAEATSTHPCVVSVFDESDHKLTLDGKYRHDIIFKLKNANIVIDLTDYQDVDVVVDIEVKRFNPRGK